MGADPAPQTPHLLRVTNTAIGGRPEGGLVMVIDFANGDGVPEDLNEVELILRSSAGTTTPGILQRNPETNGPHLAFTFDPKGADVSEFRVQLRTGGSALNEIWLYRWTKTT